jgi:cytochrome c oxidase assembly factor CtaG
MGGNGAWTHLLVRRAADQLRAAAHPLRVSRCLGHFFSRVWYSEPYLGTFCGLTRAQDQQLAGLLMWIPASLIYVGVALYLVSAMFKSDRRQNSYRHGSHVFTAEPN